MKIHLATDHAGLDLKNSIKNYLLLKEYYVEDHGAYEYNAEEPAGGLRADVTLICDARGDFGVTNSAIY